MKTMLRPSAAIDRSVRNHRLDLLGREHCGRLVHDQDPGAAIEQLQDLDALLLADRQLPDPGVGIDLQPEARRQPGDLRVRGGRPQPESGFREAEQDVLGHRLRGDQREVLVDHPEAGRDRLARRSERDLPAVHQDLAGVRLVQPGEDVHERALARAVLTEQRMDLARAHVEVDGVVGEDAGEGLDDAVRLERRHGRSCVGAGGSPRRVGHRSAG
jgi:hypothetical protein